MSRTIGLLTALMLGASTPASATGRPTPPAPADSAMPEPAAPDTSVSSDSPPATPSVSAAPSPDPSAEAVPGRGASPTPQPGPASQRSDHKTFVLKRVGTLTITAPASVNLGTGPTGGVLSAPMGTVTVRDTRGGTADWTATVASTDYTKTTSPTSTIGRANMYYWSGPAVDTRGVGTFTPGQPTSVQKVSLSIPRIAFTHTRTNGANQASWVPTLMMFIPATGILAGTYQGTITHSVA